MSLQELSAVVGIEATRLLSAQQNTKAQVIHAKPFLIIQKRQLCPIHRMYHCKSEGVEKEVQTVALVHESAREYLLHSKMEADPELHEFRIDSEQASFEMACSCLDFIHKELKSDVMSETVNCIPFLE